MELLAHLFSSINTSRSFVTSLSSRFSRRRRDILRPRWHHHQHRDDRRGLVARRVQRRLRPFPGQLRGGSTMMTPRWDDLCPRPCAKKKKKKKWEETNLLLSFPLFGLFSVHLTCFDTVRRPQVSQLAFCCSFLPSRRFRVQVCFPVCSREQDEL